MASTKYIERFMQANYSDERLAALLAHAQDGKLSYYSCCCFVGAVNANHALRPYMSRPDFCVLSGQHLEEARQLPFGPLAEDEFRTLGGIFTRTPFGDMARRKRIIKLIRKEMKRREDLRASGLSSAEANAAQCEMAK